MSQNILNDISKVYLEQVAVQEAVRGQDTEMRKAASAERRAGDTLTKKLPPSEGKKFGKYHGDQISYVDKKTKGKYIPGMTRESLDPVGKEDKDIDNDGDYDKSDKYLHKRRKAIGKAIATRKESFSNWRQDLAEVMDKIEKDDEHKQIKEKKNINNKIVINPDFKEAVEDLGGVLLESVEVDESSYLELDMKKRQEENEKSRKEIMKTKAHKDMVKTVSKHFEDIENDLDYYFGETLRPASERMKRTQTAAGRKKQEQEREKKSKLEAEADKVLAGLSKKGTGIAKTKAAPKASAPEANRKLKTGQKNDSLAMKATKAMHNEAFVDPEQGEAPSGRSPLQNVSDHPKASVRKTAVKGFKKQMSKEYGGSWKSRSGDPVGEEYQVDESMHRDAKTGEIVSKAVPGRTYYPAQPMKKTSVAIEKEKKMKKANEEVELDEKTLTPAEKRKREEIATSMSLKDFEKRYPGRGMEVKLATATKMAKKLAEADKTALDLVRQSVEKQYGKDALMTGKTKKPKPTAAQKAAAQKASANYQKKTSEYLHSSPRD